MGLLEKITANMEMTELKKFKLQKAILALMLEWKHLEEYMDSTQHSFQECLDELQHKEKYLNSVQESAVESNKEMESIRVLIEGKIKKLDDKEGEFQVFRDEQISELDLKEKQLGLIGKSIEERIKLVELREEKLVAKQKCVEGIFEEFKVEEKQFEDIRKSCEERIEEINSKGMQLDKRSKELDCVQDWIERRVKELDAKEEGIEKRCKELQHKEIYLNSVQESAVESNKEMESIRVLIEGKIKELDDKEREFQVFRDEHFSELDLKEKQLGLIGKSIEERIKLVELREEKLAAKQKCVEGIFEEFKVEEKQFEDIRKSVEERIEEINSKGMQLDKRSKELDCVQDWIERRVKELDAKEEGIEKRCKELQSKEKELNDRVREIESMARQINNVDPTKVETEVQLEDMSVNSSIDIQLFIRMDGKGLQSFLNQRERDHDSMAEEVYQALQLSSDPAKLVLDAMEGFYPTLLNEGNGEFKVDVVRRSCLLLLEQLLRISPQLQPHVKMEAMELFFQWKAKLNALPDSVEVLGLLFLLASYNLPMPFGADELSVLVEIVAEHRQTSELCRVLGLTDSVPVMPIKGRDRDKTNFLGDEPDRVPIVRSQHLQDEPIDEPLREEPGGDDTNISSSHVLDEDMVDGDTPLTDVGSESTIERRFRGESRVPQPPENLDQRIPVIIHRNTLVVPEQEDGIKFTCVATGITNAIQGKFVVGEDGPTWKKVPEEMKEYYFREWNRHYKIVENYPERQVRKIWNTMASDQYRRMCHKGRQQFMRCGHPSWCTQQDWNRHLLFYANDETRKKCEQARKNRNSDCNGLGLTKHSGGSRSFASHELAMIKNNPDKVITQDDVFLRTHKRKQGSGEFVDAKSKQFFEDYTARKKRAGFDSTAWVDASGGVAKNRLYGFGSLVPASEILSRSTRSSFAHLNEDFTQTQAFEDKVCESVERMREDIRKELKTQLQSEHASKKGEKKS